MSNSRDQLPDSASFWWDVRDHFSRSRRLKPEPAEILLGNKVIHETPTTRQARIWVKKKVKAEIPNQPGESASWLARALRAGYVIRRKGDGSIASLD